MTPGLHNDLCHMMLGNWFCGLTCDELPFNDYYFISNEVMSLYVWYPVQLTHIKHCIAYNIFFFFFFLMVYFKLHIWPGHTNRSQYKIFKRYLALTHLSEMYVVIKNTMTYKEDSCIKF